MMSAQAVLSGTDFILPLPARDHIFAFAIALVGLIQDRALSGNRLQKRVVVRED